MFGRKLLCTKWTKFGLKNSSYWLTADSSFYCCLHHLNSVQSTCTLQKILDFLYRAISFDNEFLNELLLCEIYRKLLVPILLHKGTSLCDSQIHETYIKFFFYRKGNHWIFVKRCLNSIQSFQVVKGNLLLSCIWPLLQDYEKRGNRSSKFSFHM